MTKHDSKKDLPQISASGQRIKGAAARAEKAAHELDCPDKVVEDAKAVALGVAAAMEVQR